MKRKLRGSEPAAPAMLTYNEQGVMVAGGWGEGYTTQQHAGMTIRQQFAMAAMQGLLANPKSSKHKSNVFVRLWQQLFPSTCLVWGSSDYGSLEADAVKHADALIAELNK